MIDLENRIDSVYDAVIRHRRWLHQNPELSGQEKHTAAYIADCLRKMGLSPKENMGGYGVTAVIEGKPGGKCIGLRADFDALSLQEDTGLPFASQNPGVCHACGHDMHTAMLLGAAQVLCDLKEQFTGTIKLIFQPSEEDVSDSGAMKMIAAGVMEEPHVDAMIAQHVGPQYPTGTVALRPGAMSASSDHFFIEIHGKSSHGSAPENGVDAITIGAQIISALQTIISRTLNPQDSAVLTIGTVNAGTRYNIIADSFRMEGTCRTLNPQVQDAMSQKMEDIVKGITQGMGGSYTFSYTKGNPPVINDAVACNTVLNTMKKLLGEEKITLLDKSAMIGEDFSFFAQAVPSLFYWLGCREESAAFYPLHSNHFTPDEKAMRTGIRIMISSALALLM